MKCVPWAMGALFRELPLSPGLRRGEEGGRGHSAGRGCRAEMHVARPCGACALAMGAIIRC